LSGVPVLVNGGTTNIVDFLTTWVQFLLGGLLAYALTHIEVSRAELQRLLRLYVLWAMLLAIVGIVHFALRNVFAVTLALPYLMPIYEPLGLYREASIFLEPRHFGNFVLIPMFVSVVYLNSDQLAMSSRPWRNYLPPVILGLGLLLSFSTSAYVMFFVGMFLTLYVVQGGLLESVTTYVGLVVFAVVAFAAVSVMVPRVSPLDLVITLGRLTLNQYQWNHLLNLDVQFYGLARYIRGAYLATILALQHPFLGVGLNQIYNEGYIPQSIGIATPPFALLASVGLIGFLSFWMMIVRLVGPVLRFKLESDDRRVRQVYLSVSFLLISLPVVLGSAGSRFNYPSSWFWVNLSLGAMIYVSMKDASPTPTE
jgi:hypothetical protein